MNTQLNKDERIEIRVSAQDKRIFKKAQKLSGDKTFSSFILRVVRQEAEEIVAKNDRVIAGDRDRQIFFDAIFSNQKPNQKLRNAAQNYRSKKS